MHEWMKNFLKIVKKLSTPETVSYPLSIKKALNCQSSSKYL